MNNGGWQFWCQFPLGNSKTNLILPLMVVTAEVVGMVIHRSSFTLTYFYFYFFGAFLNGWASYDQLGHGEDIDFQA